VVDLAIAANFARELTEDQFAEPRRKANRQAPAGGAPKGAVRTDAGRKGAVRTHAVRKGARRTLSRLAQVRG
jgi:hypothetical protein